MLPLKIVAQNLAEAHRKADTATSVIKFLPVPDNDEIRLLEVSSNSPTLGEILPFRFDASVANKVYYPSVIVLVNPSEWQDIQDGKLHLPSGWDIETAVQLYPILQTNSLANMPNNFTFSLPFASYPLDGKALIGKVGGDNCRHGYGLDFMKKTGQIFCSYCNLDLVSTYQNWLSMSLDHVVPVSVGKALQISTDWIEDSANKVLSCTACNGFNNRYQFKGDHSSIQSLDEFFEFRDKIFAERKALILDRHACERKFHELKLWDARF